MIQIGIHKDIVNEYQEKIIAGLSLRKLLACAVAFPIGVLIAFVMTTCWQASTDVTGMVVVIVTIPIWYIGFFRPHGMDPEKYIALWFQHNFGENKIHFSRDNNARALFNDQREKTNQAEAPTKKEIKHVRKEAEWLEKPSNRKELRARRRAWKKRQAS